MREVAPKSEDFKNKNTTQLPQRQASYFYVLTKNMDKKCQTHKGIHKQQFLLAVVRTSFLSHHIIFLKVATSKCALQKRRENIDFFAK